MDIINVTKIKHFNYLRLKWIAASVPKTCNVFCWDVASNLDSRLICQCHIRPKSQSLKMNVLPHLHFLCSMLSLAPPHALWNKAQTELFLTFSLFGKIPCNKLHLDEDQETAWLRHVHLSESFVLWPLTELTSFAQDAYLCCMAYFYRGH